MEGNRGGGGGFHSLLSDVPVCAVGGVVRVVLYDGKFANLNGMAGSVVVEEVELAHEVVGESVLVVVLRRVLVRETQVRKGGKDDNVRVGCRDRICSSSN